MISGKKLLSSLMILFFIALGGMGLILAGVEEGKYLAYFAVPVGAILTIFGGIAAMLNKVNKDF